MNRVVQEGLLPASQPVRADIGPGLSVVIPMRDEAASVTELLDGCARTAAETGRFEICVTDDGSKDGTGEVLRDYARNHPELDMTIVTLPASAGQSAAVHEAVKVARGRVICTLDGDGQNPPSEISRLVAPLLDPAAPDDLGLVAGQRVGRKDTASKRIASKLANRIRGWVLRDGTRDTGCGLKAFRRDAYLALPYFNHMHRFLPALFKRDGWEIALVDVAHAPRVAGRSKYNNFQRAIVGATDLVGVAWLIRRRKKIDRAAIGVTRTGRSEP
ncbi:glycosyltransferase family 2 protein [Paracoccus sp. SCSIO 75233]|uniref:glycosyltransferase family 2 protein n=1 Tax=Paracoccus sp. SCSIO 75233 TaxID=3017782 RepID=UPI0034A06AEA